MNGMPKRQIIASANDFRFREKSIGLNVQFFISGEDDMRPTECAMGCNPTNSSQSQLFVICRSGR